MDKRTMLASATAVLLVVATGSAAVGVSLGLRSAQREADTIGALQPVASAELLPYPERDPSDPSLTSYEVRTIEEVVEVGLAGEPPVAGGLTAAGAAAKAVERLGGGTVETVTQITSPNGGVAFRVRVLDGYGRTMDASVDAESGTVYAIVVVAEAASDGGSGSSSDGGDRDDDDDDDDHDDDDHDDDDHDDDDHDDDHDDDDD